MGAFDYDGLVFRSIDAAPGAMRPSGHYHQRGDLVWAEFEGGPVRQGSLVGVCSEDGTLRLAYCQVLVDGSVIAGDCVSHPQRLPDGRIRLREEWQRHSPRVETGVSTIEEVR